MTFAIALPLTDEPLPCAGRWEIFDSTNAYEQSIARRLCNGAKAGHGVAATPACPILEACKGILADAREAATPGWGPEGTWAGVAIGGNTPGRRRKRTEDPVAHLAAFVAAALDADW